MSALSTAWLSLWPPRTDRYVASKGSPGKSEIPDRVQHLVAHEFVAEARTFGIEDTVLRDHKRVFERGAQRISGIPQRGHIAHKTKRARPRQLATESVGLDVNREDLPADQRMIEFDFRFYPKAPGVWQDFSESIPNGDPYRFEHLDVAAGCSRVSSPTRSMAATNGAALPSIMGASGPSISIAALSTPTRKSRQDVLGSGDERSSRVAEHGGKFGRSNRSHIGRDFAIMVAVDARCG